MADTDGEKIADGKRASLPKRHVRLPERTELHDLPRAPRMIMEISRLLRSRMPRESGGVTAQRTACLLLSHLAVRDSATQSELAAIVRLRAPTVSVLLHRLEAEGYITRTPDAEDRRIMRVALSEQGRAFDALALSRIAENDNAAMRGFTEEEQAVLEGLLARIRENLLES